jgi:16S rRNA processing protein RimM
VGRQLAKPELEDWLTIGRLVGPQGLNGDVKVYPDSDFPERFLEPGQRWLLKPGAAQPQPVELLQGRYVPGKGLYVLTLAGVCDRTQAEALRDSLLMVPASDRLPLEPDEFHVGDLIGLSVVLQATGETLGTVVDVFSAGNDLLEVALNQTAGQAADKPVKVLIPFVEAIVPVVDLENRYVEITPPAGLIPLP